MLLILRMHDKTNIFEIDDLNRFFYNFVQKNIIISNKGELVNCMHPVSCYKKSHFTK